MAFPVVENFYLRVLQGIPTLTLFMLTAIDSVIIPFFLSFDFHFLFSGLYYWVIYRPDLIPPLIIILMGLFRDSITGNPFGFSSCLLLSAYAIGWEIKQHLGGRSFMLIWGGLIFYLVVTQVLEWGVFMILIHSFIDPLSLLFQLSLAILLYPLLTLILFKAHNCVPRKH
ncbi:MAG: hypothetical protein IBJ00_04645 [Alphaproteobacteria bacterium]|nr:hypothetical protein [Alphaproteobacteria bacterium]